MKAAGIFLLLLVWQTSFSQWTEDFTDGDFNQNPVWVGDTALFTVAAATLQLNAPAVSGQAYLATFSENINDADWQFRVQMAFNPSSSNYARVYLVADRQNLNGNLNGYFVKLGGTPDEVSLYRQDGPDEVKIIDGLDGRLSLSNVDVQVRVTRSASGSWQLFSQLAAETSWFNEGSTTDTNYLAATYFGFRCTYTATRSTKFYFDDITVTGSAYVDNRPPQIDSVATPDKFNIFVRFNEPVDSVTASNNANYLLNNTDRPANITATDSSITLNFVNSLPVLNRLQLSGVSDLAGNILADTTVQVIYVDPAPPTYGEVVINEIMADPSPREDLPETEFIELLNTSTKAINMTGWSFGDKISTATLPEIILLPDSLVLLSSASGAPLLSGFGQTLALSPWPSLNNSGDSLYLLNRDGDLIDLVEYSNTWYREADKADGGWSLARINPFLPCSGYLNWQAAADPSGGTPGKMNLVAVTTDTVAPVLVNYQVMADSVVLVFDEPLSDSLGAVTVDPANPLLLALVNYNQLHLSFDQAFVSEQSNTISINYLADCLSNQLSGFQLCFTPDFSPPRVDTAYANYPQIIEVTFNEPVANPVTGNFLLQGVGPPQTVAVTTTSSNRVRLTFAQNLIYGNNYTLEVDSLADSFGNMTERSLFSFVYQPLSFPGFGEVLITEIMANPTPAVGLPEEEYLELTNKTTKRLLLKGLLLSDATNETALPDGIIAPGERVILTKTTAAPEFVPFGKTIGVPNWPSLNNRQDQIALLDTGHRVIHYVPYEESWYDSEQKSAGGWALEMMDENSFCGGDKVWAASANVQGGTPGQVNSLQENLADLVIPHIEAAFALTADSILIVYEEPLSPQLPTFSVSGSSIRESYYTNYGQQEIMLLVAPLQPRVVYAITAANTTDCAGNRNASETITLTLPEEAAAGEVVVSEVLFNPVGAGVDFIEIYNNSPKYISLQNWQLRNGSSSATITNQPLLPPFGYRVFTPNRANILVQYPKAVANNVFQQQVPALANTAGTVVLANQQQTIIDSVLYDENWHFPYLSSVEGVSLERINPAQPGDVAANWASAASTENFATPGYKNSQSKDDAGNQTVQVEPKVISPDADGRDDFTAISFNLANSGSLTTIKVYNLQGQPIRQLAGNALVGSSTRFTWDGTDNNGTIVPLGHYIILIETIDQQGNTQKYREKVVVATGF